MRAHLQSHKKITANAKLERQQRYRGIDLLRYDTLYEKLQAAVVYQTINPFA